MTYRIYGSELSPYSVKVRSFFRYKNVAHEWILRSPAVQAEFQKYAKLPLVPLNWNTREISSTAVRRNQPFALQASRGSGTGTC